MSTVRLSLRAVLLCSLLGLQGAQAAVWDLAADWSDVNNPNGVWTLIDQTGAPFATNVADWDPSGSTLFGSAQPAWADAPFPDVGHVPMFFRRSSDTSALDVPLGRVGLHTATNDLSILIRWVAPITTSISIEGGVWHALHAGVHAGRAADYTLQRGGLTVSGRVTGSDAFDSATPSAFSVSGLAVNAGDLLTLSFVSGPQDVETFLGVDLRITSPDAVAPEPTPMVLVALGLLAASLAGRARGRRRLDDAVAAT